ncbi:hypothetical protein V1477_004513 [Vespula maculifrons]|uniref:Uncharacterized protein n=1 Tax=Vespula maculifrons TaxID=7453 RepID=A0ABD2CM11_VESMC
MEMRLHQWEYKKIIDGGVVYQWYQQCPKADNHTPKNCSEEDKKPKCFKYKTFVCIVAQGKKSVVI